MPVPPRALDSLMEEESPQVCVTRSPPGTTRSRASRKSQEVSGTCPVLEDSSKLKKMKKERRKGRNLGRKEGRKGGRNNSKMGFKKL